MNPGLFLSLDGIDGTGKTTQCRLLAEWLQDQGLAVTQCVDPGGTRLGAQLRELLLHGKEKLDPRCEALLFMASRAQLVAQVIKPALEQGQVVLADRFHLATVVYQGYGNGLDANLLWQLGAFTTAGVEPSLVLLLDVPLVVAAKRRGLIPDRVEERPKEYHEKVRQGFLTEAARHQSRIAVVDATGTPQQTQDMICKEIENRFGSWLKKGTKRR
jgi:dTMP kinase